MRTWFLSFYQKMRKILPEWINIQNLVFFSVISAFIIIILWSERISRYVVSMRMEGGAITITPTILPGTPTPPLPPEYVASSDQTSGIIFGVVIVLVTIVVGTIGILLRERSKQA